MILLQRLLTVSAISLLWNPLAAAQSILWDNGDFEQRAATSSERNTEVDDSWVVDDAIFDADVTITGYRWFSVLRDDWGGTRPVGVDFIVLTDDFETVVELRDLPYKIEFVGEFRGSPYFRMEVHGLDVTLPPGRYYLGGRPVGEGFYQAFTGMNSTILGQTEAYFRSAFFGFPEWTSIDSVVGTRYDIAFTVFGEVVQQDVSADSFDIPQGRLLGGDVGDLHESDDLTVLIRGLPPAALTLPNIRMDVQGHTAIDIASRLTVTVESSASRLPNEPLQRLALFDYLAQQWVIIDERSTMPVDTEIHVVITDDPTRFIEPGTGQLNMRLDWSLAGMVRPWGVRIDHAAWTVER